MTMGNKPIMDYVIEKDELILKLRARVDFLEKLISKIQDVAFFQSFFDKNGFRRVGIYGYGKYGRILGNEFESLDIEYLCAIDKNIDNMDLDIPGYSIDGFPELDVIIISSLDIDTDSVRNVVNKRNTSCRTIHIIDVLDWHEFAL